MPPIHMRTLYNLAVRCTHREYFSVLGGTHNDTFEVAGLEYYHRLRAFVKEFVDRAARQMADADLPARAQRGGSSGSRSGSGSGGMSPTEEEYLFVDKDSNEHEHVALPTMTTHFQVK